MILTQNSWHDLSPGISTEAQVLAAMGTPDRKDSNESYGLLKNLVQFEYDDLKKPSFLFQEGKLFLIYFRPDKDDNGFTSKAEPWITALGEPKQECFMNSHVDKHALLYIYPGRGLALHVVGDIVEIVEIFAAMSLDEYMNSFYVKPPVFIK